MFVDFFFLFKMCIRDRANEAFVMEDAAVYQTTGSGTVGVFFFLDLLDDLPFCLLYTSY